MLLVIVAVHFFGKASDASARKVLLWFAEKNSPGNYFGPEMNTYGSAGNLFSMFLGASTIDTDKATDTNYNVVIVRCNAMSGLASDVVDYYVNGGNKAAFTTRTGDGTISFTKSDINTVFIDDSNIIHASGNRIESGIISRAITNIELNILGNYLAGLAGTTWSAVEYTALDFSATINSQYLIAPNPSPV